MDLTSWNGVPRPERRPLDGRYARLEPLDPGRHSPDLFAAVGGTSDLFRYLPDNAPATLAEMEAWANRLAATEDPMLFAVIDRATGKAGGRQALMRIDPGYGVIEIGHVLWGPAVARSRIATEAFFLMADYAFGLGYRRFEWKCNSRNEPSKRAAARFGFTFEGIFRQHMVIKGKSRDTAWFSILDGEWPRLRAGFERWLDPANFDAGGQQRSRLAFGD